LATARRYIMVSFLLSSVVLLLCRCGAIDGLSVTLRDPAAVKEMESDNSVRGGRFSFARFLSPLAPPGFFWESCGIWHPPKYTFAKHPGHTKNCATPPCLHTSPSSTPSPVPPPLQNALSLFSRPWDSPHFEVMILFFSPLRDPHPFLRSSARDIPHFFAGDLIFDRLLMISWLLPSLNYRYVAVFSSQSRLVSHCLCFSALHDPFFAGS